MPRKPMSGPVQIGLLDYLTLGAVIQTYPRKKIESILNSTDRNSLRNRLLPAFVVVYLVVIQSLHSDVSVKENLRIILETLKRRFGKDKIKVVVKSAITKAKKRIGRRNHRCRKRIRSSYPPKKTDMKPLPNKLRLLYK